MRLCFGFARNRCCTIHQIILYPAEIDFAAVQIDAADLHTNARAYGVANTGALTAQLLSGFIETEIIAAQLSDVHQALDIHGVKRDKHAEGGDSRHGAAEIFTQVFAHVLAFQPCFNVTAGFIGATLIGAAMQAGRLPRLQLGRMFHIRLH